LRGQQADQAAAMSAAGIIDGIEIPSHIAAEAARRAFGGRENHPHLRIEAGEARMNGRFARATLGSGTHQRQLAIKVVTQGLHEAEAYRALGCAGAPVAQLYAWFSAPDGREVLLLEHLPRIGIGRGEHEFGLFVDTLARFNATAAPGLTVVGSRWLMRWLEWAQVAWERARSGAWGEPMRLAAGGLDGSWPALRVLAGDVQSELEGLPLETTHQDPNLENCGWRDDGSLVLFDLSSAGRYPAGADLGLVLGGATQTWPDARGRGPWIDRYCSARAGCGPSLPRAQLAHAVDLHVAAAVMWFDALAFERADHRFSLAGGVDAGVLAWYHRKWRRLKRMLSDGIVAAAEP
jgi:hypothetical protein